MIRIYNISFREYYLTANKEMNSSRYLMVSQKLSQYMLQKKICNCYMFPKLRMCPELGLNSVDKYKCNVNLFIT